MKVIVLALIFLGGAIAAPGEETAEPPQATPKPATPAVRRPYKDPVVEQEKVAIKERYQRDKKRDPTPDELNLEIRKFNEKRNKEAALRRMHEKLKWQR